MKQAKKFDCVQMKRDIQQRLLAEYSEMSPEQTRLAQQQRIASDTLLGPFLRKVSDSSPTPLQSNT